MTDLPPGWEWTTLGEVAETALGKMLDRGKSRGYPEVPYLRNVNVQWGRIDTGDLLTMELPPDQLDVFALREGDLLVCEGGEIGRAAIWPGSDTYVSFQKALHRVRPLEGVSSAYLLHALRWMSESGQLRERATGSTIKHLPQEQLRTLPIPLPPLTEQYRIVDEVQVVRASCASGDTQMDIASRKVQTLRVGLIDAAASDARGRTATIDEMLAAPLANGRSVPTRPGGFPVLRLTALSEDEVDLSQSKEGDWSADEAEPHVVKAGDFLVSRGNGSINLVGRGALVGTVSDPVAFPDTMIRMRARTGLVLPGFLALMWRSTAVRQQIEARAKTTAGIHKISQGDVRSIAFSLPSLDAQRAVVSEARQALDGVDRLYGTVRTMQARTRSLDAAVLARALAGELTHQDPSDEPAAALLERIRAERAAAPGKPARRRSPRSPRR